MLTKKDIIECMCAAKNKTKAKKIAEIQNEEVVNAANKGTMTGGEISRRDSLAKRLKGRVTPVKGDTEREAAFRAATYQILAKRGKKRGKKKGKKARKSSEE